MWIRVIATSLLIVQAATTLAAERVALVIGNSDYRHVPELINPGNDADDLAAKLRALEFEVIEARDLDQTNMRQKVGEFAAALQGAEVGLFFYAGHGLQISGNNYLVPIDAELTGEADVYVQLLNLRDVMAVMEAAVPTRLVLLDACRDNPLATTLARNLPKTRSTVVGQGLARMEAPQGTLIAYATAPERTAADGEGRNSPFTAALLEQIDKPGLEARQILTRVRQTVIDATDGIQVPWDESSLTGDFYFRLEISNSPLPASPSNNASTTSPTAIALAEESRLELSDADRRDIQGLLDLLGFDTGGIDGRFGPATRRAITRWQTASNLQASGFLDAASYSALLEQSDRKIVAQDALKNGSAFVEIDIRALLDASPKAGQLLLERVGKLLQLVGLDADYGKRLVQLQSGDLWGASDIGWALLDENAKAYNPPAGARLFAYAAGLGLVDVYATLGWLHYDGVGVEADMLASYRYYEIAAEAGVADGYYGIGLHHHWGAGSREIDMSIAIDNYQRSVEGGFWWAMVALGDIYREGHNGVAVDAEKARAYYRMVTEGDPPSWADSAKSRAQEGLGAL